MFASLARALASAVTRCSFIEPAARRVRATRPMRVLVQALGFTAFALVATQAQATFHLWVIDQIYYDSTGNVQFIELFTSAGGQQFVGGHSITASSGNNPVHTFTFAADLPSDTTNKHFLIATQGFAALGIVKPDYVVPNGFFYTPSGSINYAGVDIVNYQSLPTDGVHSIAANGTPMVNSATNFAGQTGSIAATPPPSPPMQPPPMQPPASKSAQSVWSGQLVRTAGPAFSAVPFDPNRVTRTVVGTATFTFTDGANGTFAYTVNGVSQVKNFTREVFVAPGTACQ